MPFIDKENTRILPLMPLREVVMFPHAIIPLFVGREASIAAIEKSISDYDKHIFLVTQRNGEDEQPDNEGLFTTGTVARILQMLRLPDGTIKVLFEGLYRAQWEAPAEEATEEDHEEADSPKLTPIVLAQTWPLPEDVHSDTAEADALIRTTQEALTEYAHANKHFSQETLHSILAYTEPGRVADATMPHLKTEFAKKQEILETSNNIERLTKVYELLQREISIVSMEKKIKGRVKGQMERNQREYYLNEQIKAIHKEMGREEDPQAEVTELEARLAKKNMPDEAREKAQRELKKLHYIPPSSAEHTVIRNYVDWILDLPWQTYKEAPIDINKAREVLDADHFGLEKPKERILEFLAVQKLVNKLKGPILCLVGPPGVGKTSLAKSIANATGREFARLSLGGVRDEAEVRGHRRTYVGALPGKIIQSLKRVSSSNPLFCLDEIDKMSTDFRGDPASALLEVLDPEQNNSFNDHYLDMDYDLSQVFFITTANSLHSIPLPLQDRMEIIRLPGYLETEKLHIAKEFLLPKQIGAHGLKPEQLNLSDAVLLEIIRSYTHEAGVRSLERELATLCRKTAMQIVENAQTAEAVAINLDDLQRFLGVKKYRHGEREENPQIGVSTGLAYTEVGGEMLVVETALMPGTGKVATTGKLGEVMTESAKAAFSYIRSRSTLFGLRDGFYKDIDMHIHVPEGAIPKDGPSAGITLATSMVSALLGIPTRPDVAMTGEITLRGRVLPIGGLREKLLAAHRGMITTVLIPKDNEKDLADVPADILQGLTIIPVANMDEVLPKALMVESIDELTPGREDCTPISRSLSKAAESGAAAAQ